MPLHAACFIGKIDIINCMIENGAEINAKDSVILNIYLLFRMERFDNLILNFLK